MFDFDKNLYSKYKLIAGIDEVGRGCLFGEVYACAIIMPENSNIPGVDDSKKLSEKKREELYDKIINEAVSFGIGTGTVEEINLYNIKNAVKMAMLRAVQNLEIRPDLLLIDFEELDTDINSISIAKGDSISYNIACASIVAKVLRDRKCLEWDETYPGYFIAKNKGYGTKQHREAILKLGETKLHREKFLRKILGR